MKYLFFLILTCNFINASEEFIIPKKNEKISQSNLKDSIIEKSGTVLNLNTNLDEVSLDLRKFILNQTESAIKDDNQFLLNATNKELSTALDELKILEKDMNEHINSLKKRLSNLKKKFNIK